jgi:imidazolonepropionase-like amidohydrolase
MSRRLPVVVATLCCALAKTQAQPAAQNTTAIEHVNVVDVVAGEIRNDQTVLISDGRITIAGPAASVAHPPEAKIIRAQGKYLLPGLWDMHVHLRSASNQPGVPLHTENESVLGLFLANGNSGHS